MTASIIIVVIVAAIVAAAVRYIIKEKKRGVKCIGCPLAGECSAKNKAENGCSCHGDSE